MVPWKLDKLMVWDVTCPDSFIPSYIASATSTAGTVPALARIGRGPSRLQPHFHSIGHRDVWCIWSLCVISAEGAGLLSFAGY